MVILFVAIIIDTNISSNAQKTDHIRTIGALTKLPPPALSVRYLEPRVRAYKDYRIYLYPKMQPITYLGFVYAK